MRTILLEICCGSADDVILAAQGGADRVELNSCLFLGGLTPSIGALEVARDRVSIPILAMARPRQGGFCYTDAEFQTLLADARELLHHGADGVVFGCLNPDGTVDADRCRRVLDVIGDATSVFHRAIDVVPNWKKALSQLITLGVTRVLTSGQEPDVFQGLATVADMVRFAGDAIEILPGAGVTLRNALRVVQETGVSQVHLARHRPALDPSTVNNREIFYGGALYPPEDRYDVTDADYVRAVRETLM